MKIIKWHLICDNQPQYHRDNLSYKLVLQYQIYLTTLPLICAVRAVVVAVTAQVERHTAVVTAVEQAVTAFT